MLVRNKRWTVSPRRFVISVVLGVVGTFVLFGGLGMWSFNIGAIGFAVIAGGAGVYAVSAVTSRHTYVAGDARVIYASLPPPGALVARCNMRLIVRAPNISALSIRMRDPQVPVAKWPVANVILPVQIAVGDPHRIRIRWDEVNPQNWVRPSGADHSVDDLSEVIEPTGEAAEVDRHGGAIVGDGADPGVAGWNFAGAEIVTAEFDAADVMDAEAAAVELVDVDDDEDGLDDVDVTEVEGRRSIEIDLPGVQLSPPSLPPRKPSPRPRTSPESRGGAQPESVGRSAVRAAPPAVPMRFSDASLLEADTADEDVPLFDQDMSHGSAKASRSIGWVRAATVTVFVRDLGRSVAFYRDVLGFREVDTGRQRAMLTTGDARIVLKEAETPPGDRRTVQVMLTVPDIDEAYRHLRAARAELVHRPRRISKENAPTTWAAQFRDPDGHAIVLVEEPTR